MGQPWFWTALLVVVVVAGLTRLILRRPFAAGRAAAVPVPVVVLAGLAALALVFHCTAMFFTPWVAAIPGTGAAIDAVNAMGPASQIAYWLPAAVLVVALRQAWWPALTALAVCLAGVGVTMFWSFPLPTHLAWLTAAVLVVAMLFTAFVDPGRTPRPLAIRSSREPGVG